MIFAAGSIRPTVLCLGVLLAAACERPSIEDATQPTDSTMVEAPLDGIGRVYERSLVFISNDSVALPWLLHARSQPGGVARRARGWLARSGEWDRLYDAEWESPPTRVPWRIVPHDRLRLIVGEQESLESVILRDGTRQFEIQVEESIVEWRAPGGETYQVSEATTLVGDAELRGVFADLSRSWRAEETGPGDWAFLVSGDSLQALLVAPEPGAGGRPYRAWAWWSYRELQWPEVRVEWTEVRAYEPARRDVPGAWSLDSGDGELTGTLAVTSSELQVGSGEGLFLPVDALFGVSGTLVLEGREIPVQGVLRHVQP